MPISVDWPNKIITVPQSYLTPLGGGVYELDVDQFRLDLKDLEDDPDGMPWPDTHVHNTEIALAGATYARTFEIINGYTVLFEESLSPPSAYTVLCTGANHNIGDVKIVNSVSLIIGNAAGLIVTDTSGLTTQESTKLLATAEETHEIKGAPSYNLTTQVFEFHAHLLLDGDRVSASAATALLYEGGDQGSILADLGAGSLGVLDVFHWTKTSVTITPGLTYFLRVAFTVPGSPADVVTKDLSFTA